MAADAALRRRFEPNLSQLGICTGRPMAIDTADYAMAAEQCERRRPVIERLHLAPGAHFMARFTHALRRLQPRLQCRRKLAVVRILVAAFASAVREMIFAVGALWRSFLAMAIQTGDRR